MKEIFKNIFVVLIFIFIVIVFYLINEYSSKISSQGVYTCCKITGFNGFKSGPGLLFDIYYRNDTISGNCIQNGDILKKTEMKDKYFVIRFVPNHPELKRVLLRYELNESIAKQIDSGVSTLGQILILPGVKIHEEIVNFDDGL